MTAASGELASLSGGLDAELGDGALTAWIRLTRPSTMVYMTDLSSLTTSCEWDSSHSIENADSATNGGLIVLMSARMLHAWRRDMAL